MSLTSLGVAGWTLSDGRHTIVADPYFTRPADLAHAVSDAEAVAARAPARVDLVLVGHALVDHALDAPAVARPWARRYPAARRRIPWTVEGRQGAPRFVR